MTPTHEHLPGNQRPLYWGSRFSMKARGPSLVVVGVIVATGERAADLLGVAIVGGEREVEGELRALDEVGATDFLAVMFPAEDDARKSIARTRAFLKDLIGNV